MKLNHRWNKSEVRGAMALLAAGIVAVAPAQAYDLRALTVSTGMAFGQPPGPADERYTDLFNNGNPLVGPAYVNGVAGSGSYLTYGTPAAGAELGGADTDWFGQNLGVGRLRFQQADAAPAPSNLDAPGTLNLRESLILGPPATPLLIQSQQWEAEAYWNYALPTAGSSYGIRISDNPRTVNTAGLPYNDLIDLRLVRGNVGTPVVSLRRLTWDGSVLSVAQSFSYQLTTALATGKTLADVAAIGFRLHYNAPIVGDSGGLVAGLDLLGTAGEEVGYINYAPVLEIFRGETATNLLANANWNTAAPVPEPATWALWLAGVAAVGLRQRRRRQGAGESLELATFSLRPSRRNA